MYLNLDRLFDAKLSLGSLHRKELLRFSTTAGGHLVVSVVARDGTELGTTAESASPLSDGSWHRVAVSSVSEQKEGLQVEVDEEELDLTGRWDGLRFYNVLDFGEPSNAYYN